MRNTHKNLTNSTFDPSQSKLIPKAGSTRASSGTGNIMVRPPSLDPSVPLPLTHHIHKHTRTLFLHSSHTPHTHTIKTPFSTPKNKARHANSLSTAPRCSATHFPPSFAGCSQVGWVKIEYSGYSHVLKRNCSVSVRNKKIVAAMMMALRGGNLRRNR